MAAQTGSGAAGRGMMKGKMVAGVTDTILVIHVTGKDEFTQTLYEKIACLLGYLICNFHDWHGLNQKG